MGYAKILISACTLVSTMHCNVTYKRAYSRGVRGTKIVEEDTRHDAQTDRRLAINYILDFLLAGKRATNKNSIEGFCHFCVSWPDRIKYLELFKVMLKSVTITCAQTQRLDWQHPTFPSLLGKTHFLPWFILGNFVCHVKKTPLSLV